MKKLVFLVTATAAVALVVVAFAAGAAQKAQPVSALLKSTTEVPKPKGAKLATGVFNGSYTTTATGATMTFKLTYAHLTGPGLSAHIHAGAAGVAGPVLFLLCGPCKNGLTMKMNITSDVIAAIRAKRAYVNVHTAANPAGEVRGQITLTAAPLPKKP